MAKKKATSRKAAKKTTRKKSTRKTARKKVTRKATKKKTTKKAAKKKTTKKKVARKKTAKKATGKKTAKKSTKKKSPKKKTTKKATKRKTTRKAASKKSTSAPTKRKTAGKKAAAAPAPAVTKRAPARPKPPRRSPHVQPDIRVVPPPVVDVTPITGDAPLPPEPPAILAEPVTGYAETRVAPDVGDIAPDFDLPDQDNQIHTLSQYRGRKVVLYFYPKDDTPGCTTEACGFRDARSAIAERGAVVLGISPDPPSSHGRFAQKFGLNFPLLADEDHAVAEAYGVWVEKKMYGNVQMGVARTTFIIDTDGRIAHVFKKVRPEGHDQEVLDFL